MALLTRGSTMALLTRYFTMMLLTCGFTLALLTRDFTMTLVAHDNTAIKAFSGVELLPVILDTITSNTVTIGVPGLIISTFVLITYSSVCVGEYKHHVLKVLRSIPAQVISICYQ